MNRIENSHRRLDAAVAPVVAVLERCSRPTVACFLSGVVGITWLVLISLVKVRLLNSCILTSDIAYYQNMLYNTGFSFSPRSFDFLFTWYDLLHHGSPTYLTEHFSPTLAILAPIYWVFPHPIFLTVMQPVLNVLAGWGLFRLSRRLLELNEAPPMVGLLPVFFQAAFLFNYSNITAIIDSVYGFHQDSMIAPLLVWTMVCVVEKRWWTTLVAFVLFLGVKENLPIITATGLGFCLVFNRIVPRKKAALGLLLCAAFFSCCYYFEFRTHNRHVSIIHKFFDYDYLMEATDRTAKWTVLVRLWPALFTPFLALPALTDWCLQIVGDTTELDWHSYPVMMYSQIAFAFTCIKLFSLTKRWRIVSLAGLAALLGLVTVPMMVAGAQTYAVIHRSAFSVAPLADVPALDALKAAVPKSAKLAATSDLLIFLSERRRLLWPESMAYAEYVIVNRRTEAENLVRANDFSQTRPDGNLGGVHFYEDIYQVARGYGYDTALIAYMDQLTAAGGATLLKSDGRLSLYRIHSPVPFALH